MLEVAKRRITQSFRGALIKDCANVREGMVRRDILKQKLLFVPYITSGIIQGIIIIEKNRSKCTRHSALEDSQTALSGTSLSSQHWDDSIWHCRIFPLISRRALAAV